MTLFHDFLREKIDSSGFSTEDTLVSFLPLMRDTLDAHLSDYVAPLVGLQDLHVEGSRIWFEQASRKQPLKNRKEIDLIQSVIKTNIEVVRELKRTDDLSDSYHDFAIVERGEPIKRPVFVRGFVAWEHELEHHDPLTDIFSLGMILASLACSLDFTIADDLEQFVRSRDNLFRLNPGLHPVIARAIVKMTELDRHRRSQDLPALLTTLENYRDQEIDFEFDLARIGGLGDKDVSTRQTIVLDRLRERLFELSRRNRLLHFRANMQSVNLTHSSIPLSFDHRHIRPDQILTWTEDIQKSFVGGKPVSLNKYLNFSEAIYLPSVLTRIITDTRRDQAEYGFAQLRLVVCFLHWANLKEKPIEQYDSPLVLLPVKLTKKKGISDTYYLEVVETEAEINPVIRHQFKQLYNIELPETFDLAKSSIDDLFEYLSKRIESSDVSVTLKKIDRPRISLIHERAKRRLDQYRRRARLSGRGVRRYLDFDYSYDPANYHPLGIKLFNELVKPPQTQVSAIIEEKPRPRTYMVSHTEENDSYKERSFYNVQQGGEENPYTWTFDLCSVTLANFKYRKMSLVRDYDSLIVNESPNEAFESIFSLDPKPVTREIPEPPSLDERYDVVPCDPTQAAAIDEARAGKSYIIQGPPGTGKSQTITNLIGDYVARGKRVLFVCEKRAAIDVVYARLRQCGLKKLCSLIHDSQTDKKEFVMDLKETYESFLNEHATDSNQGKNRQWLLERMKNELQPLERFDDEMTQHQDDLGMSLRMLLDECIARADQCPKLTAVENETLPNFALWETSQPSIERYISALKRIEPDTIAANHPLALVSPRLLDSDHPVETVSQSVPRALDALDRILEITNALEIKKEHWVEFRCLHQLMEYANDIHFAARAGQMNLLDSHSSARRDFQKRMITIEDFEAKVTSCKEKTSSWKNKLPESEAETALRQASQFEGSWFKWLMPSWWRLRGIMHRCYDFATHVIKPTWREVLENLVAEYQAIDELNSQESRLARELELDESLREFVEKLKQFEQAQLPRYPHWLQELHLEIANAPDSRRTIEQLLGAERPLDDFRQHLQTFSDADEIGSLDQCRQMLSEIRQKLNDLPEYLAAIRELSDVPKEVSRAVRTLRYAPNQLIAAAAHRNLEKCYLSNRDLESITGNRRSEKSENLAGLYDQWLVANAKDIELNVQNRFLQNVHVCNQSASQLDADQKEFKKFYNKGRRELEHEFGKSMRYKPIRELVSGESGEVVKDLKPVWLMSPLSVSDTLPLDSEHFDVVIFDEASQITLEESVPSIFRAAQSIVVGDQMQLPPTDFFSAKRKEDEEELEFEDEGEVIEYDLESNSFLNHSAKNLPSTMLGWHYRSRSESLISFSNWKFYDGRLLTVPEEEIAHQKRDPIIAKTPADAQIGSRALLERSVSFHFTEHGVYTNRRNTGEAEYIAELVRELLSSGNGKTIGVVAFSEAQQTEIEEALNRLASDDKLFANRLEAEFDREEDGQFVGLLVKNLENIQGDERDIVILSVCYGHDSQGKMRMNFGPINKSGGEKRLNVAFSRAKHHMALVSSIKHTAITNDYNDGANCLKQYLRYAESISTGDFESATQILHGMSRWQDSREVDTGKSVLAESIAKHLSNRGFIVDQNIGQSHFRCDLAIRKPGDDVYRLGILLDNKSHYEESDILERDIMRPRLLKAFGWNIATVIAKDWQSDRDREIERLASLAAQ